MKKVKYKDGEIDVFCCFDKLVITELVEPNNKNPNVHPEEQISLLSKIIQKQGWRSPITISKRSNKIVKGHGRLQAAKKLGCIEVPVDFQEYDTEADEIADLMADNKLSELSEFDTLAELELKQILIEEDFDLELAGLLEYDIEIKDKVKDISCDDKDLPLDDDLRIEIKCRDENQQEELYDRFTMEGLECRVLKL